MWLSNDRVILLMQDLIIMFPASLEKANTEIGAELDSHGADNDIIWCGAEWLHMVE